MHLRCQCDWSELYWISLHQTFRCVYIFLSQLLSWMRLSATTENLWAFTLSVVEMSTSPTGIWPHVDPSMFVCFIVENNYVCASHAKVMMGRNVPQNHPHHEKVIMGPKCASGPPTPWESDDGIIMFLMTTHTVRKWWWGHNVPQDHPHHENVLTAVLMLMKTSVAASNNI